MSNQRSRMRERLIAAGCPVDPIDPQLESSQRGLVIRSVSDNSNCIFELSNFGGIGYVVDIVISNPRSRPYTVCELSVDLPWVDPQFYFLEDPHEQTPACEEYVFSRHLTFPRKMVLNHRVLDYGRIPGYGWLRGLLLARSFCSIPASFHHGSEVRAVVHVTDQVDTDHLGDFSLYVDRSAAIQRGECGKRKFPGLFGPGVYEDDSQPPRESSAELACESFHGE